MSNIFGSTIMGVAASAAPDISEYEDAFESMNEEFEDDFSVVMGLEAVEPDEDLSGVDLSATSEYDDDEDDFNDADGYEPEDISDEDISEVDLSDFSSDDPDELTIESSDFAFANSEPVMTNSFDNSLEVENTSEDLIINDDDLEDDDEDDEFTIEVDEESMEAVHPVGAVLSTVQQITNVINGIPGLAAKAGADVGMFVNLVIFAFFDKIGFTNRIKDLKKAAKEETDPKRKAKLQDKATRAEAALDLATGFTHKTPIDKRLNKPNIIDRANAFFNDIAYGIDEMSVKAYSKMEDRYKREGHDHQARLAAAMKKSKQARMLEGAQLELEIGDDYEDDVVEATESVNNDSVFKSVLDALEDDDD